MNNLLSYCGLVDARISASEKIYLYRIPLPPLYWKKFQSQNDRLCQEFQPQKTDDCLTIVNNKIKGVKSVIT